MGLGDFDRLPNCARDFTIAQAWQSCNRIYKFTAFISDIYISFKSNLKLSLSFILVNVTTKDFFQPKSATLKNIMDTRSLCRCLLIHFSAHGLSFSYITLIR